MPYIVFHYGIDSLEMISQTDMNCMENIVKGPV